ncbi:amidohydrolase [Leadbettera azotonutricia]|uniref:Thermostable carboxypeptidase 1 n=1 Tax=Leadbettera azotonutricia (strain ATCC BAA-888 / DSM 13862 / ZAS-9) TaxID=545695 RepID=F5Y9R9_LEAAZ|nr:amidohydrolase [Leadbettera azotonutricia]AEF80185.1 thermostable carboxypeptidase 1 [Leadbettera azotonutricia ZAS-9]
MEDLQNQLENYFKWFHRHPELSNQEYGTTKKIKETLESLGIEVLKTDLKTGLVALIRGKTEGPITALRADIDALPVQEASGVEWASENVGVSHACGHDFHTTALIGAASLLRENPPERGSVLILFQPAEEGGDGALQVLEAGVLDGVSRIYGLHVDPSLERGSVGIRAGAAWAAVGRFLIRLIGKGGHAAKPHLCADPIVAVAAIINSAQTIVSRFTDPFDNRVVSFTRCQAGSTWNVIPPEAVLEGTIRAMTNDALEKAMNRLDEICKGTALAYHVEPDFSWVCNTAAVNNDPALSEKAAVLARNLGFAVKEPLPTMGGEDFAFYQQRIPGFFFNFGTGGGTAEKFLHSPFFAADPLGLSRAAALLAALAVSESTTSP